MTSENLPSSDEHAAVPVEGPVQLLSASDYGNAVDTFFGNAIEFIARKSDRVYASMHDGASVDGIDAVTVEVAGTSVASPMVNVSYAVPIDPEDVRNTNLEALHAAVQTAAESKLDQVLEAYTNYLDEALAAVGHNVRISKDTFGWGAMFELLEKVEWAEGADGRVHAPQGLFGDAVPELPKMTPDEERRIKAIDDRKQQEHVARRRSRRLR